MKKDNIESTGVLSTAHYGAYEMTGDADTYYFADDEYDTFFTFLSSNKMCGKCEP